MTAKLVATTRKRAHSFSVADEIEKNKIRNEYRNQDADTPYRLFVSTPGKPTVHTTATVEAAKQAFSIYAGRRRVLTNMRTGHILMFAQG